MKGKSKMLTMFLKAAINIASAKKRKLYIAGGNLLYFIACKVQFTVNIAILPNTGPQREIRCPGEKEKVRQ